MNCGTEKGLLQHKARNEPPCKWCIKFRDNPAPKVAPRITKPKPVRVPKPRPASQAKCGTTAGFHKHRYNQEPVCDPCRLAHNEYQRGRYKAAEAKPKKEPKHGTPGGRTNHVRNKEPVCDPCRLAYNKATRDRYQAKKAANP